MQKLIAEYLGITPFSVSLRMFLTCLVLFLGCAALLSVTEKENWSFKLLFL